MAISCSNKKNKPKNPVLVGIIAVVRLLDPEAADENGYITIPTESDCYKVTELGDIGDGIFLDGKDSKTFYKGSNKIERFIIPSEIKIININFFTWLSVKYVEFISDEPYIYIHDEKNYNTTWIVPNGDKGEFLSSGISSLDHL